MRLIDEGPINLAQVVLASVCVRRFHIRQKPDVLISPLSVVFFKDLDFMMYLEITKLCRRKKTQRIKGGLMSLLAMKQKDVWQN